MAIKFAETSSPAALTESAKTVRRQAEAIEAALNEVSERRGRGRPASGKETVTLRLDARTVAFFKAGGDTWREAMADVLDKAAPTHDVPRTGEKRR